MFIWNIKSFCLLSSPSCLLSTTRLKIYYHYIAMQTSMQGKRLSWLFDYQDKQLKILQGVSTLPRFLCKGFNLQEASLLPGVKHKAMLGQKLKQRGLSYHSFIATIDNNSCYIVRANQPRASFLTKIAQIYFKLKDQVLFYLWMRGSALLYLKWEDKVHKIVQGLV